MESAAPRPRPPDRHCKDCKHWGGWAESYIAGMPAQNYARCLQGRAPSVQAMPERGCAFWESWIDWRPITWRGRPLRPQDEYIDPAG